MLYIGVDHTHHVAAGVVIREPFAVINAEDLHALVITKVGKQLRGDEEVLPSIRFTGDVHQRVMSSPLIRHVHTLIDLVDKTEGSFGVSGQAHEVQDGGERALLHSLVS